MAQRFKMASIAFALFFLCTPLLRVQAVALPIDSRFRCRRASPQLNECVRDGLAAVIQYFKSGNNELGVPSLDPLAVPYLQTRHEDTRLSLELTMKNILITGFTDFELAKVTTNLDDVNKLEVTGRTPSLHVAGEYLTDGLLVTFPLHSAGHFTINMTEVSQSWVVYLREMTQNKTKYLQIDGFDIEMMPINIAFKPAGQLDGDNNLGEAVNVILNENSNEIYSIIKGKLATLFSGLLTDLANHVLAQVPESQYLL